MADVNKRESVSGKNIDQLKGWASNVGNALASSARGKDLASDYIHRNEEPTAKNEAIESLPNEPVPGLGTGSAPAAPAPDNQQIEQGFENTAQPVTNTDGTTKTPSQQLLSEPSSLFEKGFKHEAQALGQLGKDESSLYSGLEEKMKPIEAEKAANQKRIEEETSKWDAEIAKHQEALSSFKIHPSSFFSNKNTWQKIVGGIGMFLGSITPEGARNVATIVNNEIERDTKKQMMEYDMMKERRNDTNNRFKQKVDMFKDKNLALLSLKQDMYSATEIQLKKIQAAAKSPLAAAAAEKGIAAIQEEQRKTNLTFSAAMAKTQQKANNGAVPGYIGSIPDETSARAFRGQLSARDSALPEIDNLIAINKKNKLSQLTPSVQKDAKSSQTLLQGQLREILVGPGAVNDSERVLMKDVIADPTKFFSLESSNGIALEKLKKAIQNKVEANAKYYGLQKESSIVPPSWSKIQ